MATLILICGLPGAGKTTRAKQIEQSRPALRLTPDEWIAQIIADASDIEELDRLRSPMEALLWGLAQKTLALGMDVILDWGFWAVEERAYYRAQAEAMGAQVETVFLLMDREELWERLAKRNANLPAGTFCITREQLDCWWELFQPPTPEELGIVP